MGSLSPPHRSEISRRVEERTGHALGPDSRSAEVSLPEDVVLADGLSEEEAVAVALWNNRALQADLAELGFARADLLEAGLLRDPVLSLLFPSGPKQLEATLKWPLDVLWQRPRRVAAVRASAEAVAERLVQHGLVLMGEVRVAFADLVLARERARLGEESARLHGQIAEIARARLRAGDVSELAARVVTSEAALASLEAGRLTHEVVVAEERLRSLLSLGLAPVVFEISPAPSFRGNGRPCGDLAERLRDALAARPDLRAAELRVEAAAKRAGWEKSRILSLIGILDANEDPDGGLQTGPGLETPLPLFERNQAAIARAEAELAVAARAYLAVRDTIVLDVRQAGTRLAESREALAGWRSSLLPALELDLLQAERTYGEGEAAYLFVLETTRRLTDGRIRAAEAEAEVRRAGARLDQSVGRTCAATS